MKLKCVICKKETCECWIQGLRYTNESVIHLPGLPGLTACAWVTKGEGAWWDKLGDLITVRSNLDDSRICTLCRTEVES